MNTKDIITIIIRLLALFVLIYGIQNTASVIVFWSQTEAFTIEAIWSILLPFAFVFLLWLLTPKLAQLVAADLPQEVDAKINHIQLMRVVVISTAMFLLINSLIHAGYLFFNSWVFKANPEFSAAVDVAHSLKSSIATELIQLLIAFTMLAKNYWLSLFLLKINAPESTIDSNQPSHPD